MRPLTDLVLKVLELNSFIFWINGSGQKCAQDIIIKNAIQFKKRTIMFDLLPKGCKLFGIKIWSEYDISTNI